MDKFIKILEVSSSMVFVIIGAGLMNHGISNLRMAYDSLVSSWESSKDDSVFAE